MVIIKFFYQKILRVSPPYLGKHAKSSILLRMASLFDSAGDVVPLDYEKEGIESVAAVWIGLEEH